ncbi:unnamed protein product [Cuscuta campestris]|uniref:STICHEL DnaA-N-like alpha-beta domain-containing protein n=1 Tax=Cuscuta campestris TaxID=132261 RepID=A0A484N4M1_9ASTE|nr:unnamed protein product [Cuscuta campestris]
MDGRRRSVDIPITRTLVALRRVKSLRDPTTNSMGKLSAFVENSNWDADSGSLGFGKNEDVSDYGPRKPNSRFVSQETPSWVGNEEYDEGVGSSHERNEEEEEEEEEVDGFDLGSNGCGISSCWLGTPRLRGSNLLQDAEQKPLLSCQEPNNLTSCPETTSLYQNKFRPKMFGELVGQNAVATALMSSVANKQIHPLYLFHGPRGTGKTCASRIFAAALNCLCLSPHEEKPCGLCLECVLFFSGRRGVDVKEINCLKTSRTERVKRLVAKSACTPPLSSRFKVFILDECHLLGEETWGAILNGNSHQHVVFVAITPDLDKLPRAVVSRAQKYYFPKLKEDDIAGRLGRICKEEGVEFDDDALLFVSRKSNGSLRDGEMMLEQLSLLGKRITMPLVYELTGAVSDEELMELLLLALSSDTCKTVKTARELMRSRIDPMQLISQLANLIMDILSGKRAIGGRFSELSAAQLSHALRILSETEKQLRTSKSQTTWLTAALVQLSSVGSSADSNEARVGSRTVYPQEVDGGNCCSTSSSTGESLKHLATHVREGSRSCQLGMHDDKETLMSIWSRAIARCESNSLKTFLLRRGSLSSICLEQGIAIAELKFSRPDYVSTAEKSWKLIANALQQTLCCNVELRINLTGGEISRNRPVPKNPSLSLFGCSRGARHKPEFSLELGGDGSEASDFGSRKSVEKCPSQRISQKEMVRRSIRDNDGNALSVGVADNGWTPEEEKDRRHSGCFPKRVDHLKRSFSSNDSRAIRSFQQQPSRNFALSILKKTSSEAPFYAGDPRPISCSQPSNSCPGNKDIPRPSKFHCLRTVLSPFRKALGLKRHPENAHLQLVMPCPPST